MCVSCTIVRKSFAFPFWLGYRRTTSNKLGAFCYRIHWKPSRLYLLSLVYFFPQFTPLFSGTYKQVSWTWQYMTIEVINKWYFSSAPKLVNHKYWGWNNLANAWYIVKQSSKKLNSMKCNRASEIYCHINMIVYLKVNSISYSLAKILWSHWWHPLRVGGTLITESFSFKLWLWESCKKKHNMFWLLENA